jgi:archaemetzincin
VRLSRRQALLLSVVPALSALAASGRAGAAALPLVEVRPIGVAPGDADVDAVVAAIRAFFAVDVTVSAAVPLPRAAYYPPRGRYRAERLLDFLTKQAGSGARVALGLTTVDISTTKGRVFDWGVLGLATLDGRSAVLSSFRCKRGARDAGHARERFAKTAVHELGHSFGLEHCPTPGCLMHDGEGSVLTSDGETDFCPATRARLTAAHVLVADARSPFIR